MEITKEKFLELYGDAKVKFKSMDTLDDREIKLLRSLYTAVQQLPFGGKALPFRDSFPAIDGAMEALEKHYGLSLATMKFTKAQAGFLRSCWADLANDADPNLPFGVIEAGTSMGGENEDTKMMNALAKKGVLTYEHNVWGTDFTFLKDTPVPGVYKGNLPRLSSDGALGVGERLEDEPEDEENQCK
jgi:hypothetical protein